MRRVPYFMFYWVFGSLYSLLSLGSVAIFIFVPGSTATRLCICPYFMPHPVFCSLFSLLFHDSVHILVFVSGSGTNFVCIPGSAATLVSVSVLISCPAVYSVSCSRPCALLTVFPCSRLCPLVLFLLSSWSWFCRYSRLCVSLSSPFIHACVHLAISFSNLSLVSLRHRQKK